MRTDGNDTLPCMWGQWMDDWLLIHLYVCVSIRWVAVPSLSASVTPCSSASIRKTVDLADLKMLSSVSNVEVSESVTVTSSLLAAVTGISVLFKGAMLVA